MGHVPEATIKTTWRTGLVNVDSVPRAIPQMMLELLVY